MELATAAVLPMNPKMRKCLIINMPHFEVPGRNARTIVSGGSQFGVGRARHSVRAVMPWEARREIGLKMAA